eukprot:TRINITY_DN134_c0_g1_i3.p1 TRINITY_DN134_c0_g1~~TRINITY_DN134_c0_g1_i3.p1  ORF type:complete len:285 (-),score=65.33 TRINITY_DN134_c0_g1_i3:139-993(-)
MDITHSFFELVNNTYDGKIDEVHKASTKSTFSGVVHAISNDLRQTSMKVKEMTQLARQRTVYNDPSIEISKLAESIETDVKNCKTSITQLEDYIKGFSSALNGQTKQHSEEIIVNLKSNLFKQTNSLKRVLADRDSRIKSQQKRRSQFGTRKKLGRPLIFAPPSVSSASPSEALSTEQHQSSALQTQLIAHQTYASRRAQDAEEIHSQVAEVATLTRRLAGLVESHDPMLERLGENIEDAFINIDGGQQQLQEHLEGQRSGTYLMMKIFFILLGFLLFFMMFVA